MVTRIVKGILQRIFPNSLILLKASKVNGVILTFDDGPHPEHTPIILETLSQENIKAVFFVTGGELAKYPELGKEIVRQGHLLGNHTFEHLDIKDCTLKEYENSIKKSETYIARSYPETGYQYLFRPPYSSFSIPMLRSIIFSDYLLLNWTIDSRDSYIKEEKKLTEYACSMPMKKGDILLFHEDYKQTVAALPEILASLHNRGIQFALPRIPKRE